MLYIYTYFDIKFEKEIKINTLTSSSAVNILTYSAFACSP